MTNSKNLLLTLMLFAIHEKLFASIRNWVISRLT